MSDQRETWSRVTFANGETRVPFARFEIILRREAGRWRILVDQDTADGGTITDAMFAQRRR